MKRRLTGWTLRQLIPQVGHVRGGVLLAAAMTAGLHLLMQACLSGQHPSAGLLSVPSSAAAAYQSAHAAAQAWLDRIPWAALALLCCSDLTVAGGAMVLQSLDAVPATQLCPPGLQATPAEQHHGTAAPAPLPRSSSTLQLQQELANCSSQAHRWSLQLAQAGSEARALRQQRAACAVELLGARARAAATTGVRLWATAASAACVALVLQLRGRRVQWLLHRERGGEGQERGSGSGRGRQQQGGGGGGIEAAAPHVQQASLGDSTGGPTCVGQPGHLRYAPIGGMHSGPPGPQPPSPTHPPERRAPTSPATPPCPCPQDNCSSEPDQPSDDYAVPAHGRVAVWRGARTSLRRPSLRAPSSFSLRGSVAEGRQPAQPGSR